MNLNGGSQGELREHNERRIVDWVREHPGATQLEIARGVDLTRAAVAKLIGSDPPEGASNGQDASRLRRVLDGPGRPARMSIKATAGCVMSVDIGAYHIRVRIADLAGKPITDFEEQSQYKVDSAKDPDRAFDLAGGLMNEALSDANFNPDQLAGLVIGVPYPVDGKGVVITGGAWPYVQLPTNLLQRLGWPPDSYVRRTDSYRIESVVNLGALAELDAALDEAGLIDFKRENAYMLYIRWGMTIDAAVIIAGGELYRGSRGMAGHFAHGPIHDKPDELPSECEHCNAHCANSVASLRAFGESPLPNDVDFKELGADSETRVREFVKLARSDEDPETAKACDKVLQEAAQTLGRALGIAVNTLNPRLVVVGGAFHEAEYEHVAHSLQQGVDETVFDRVREGLTIQPGRRTGEAAVVGGLSLALREFAARYLLEQKGQSKQLSPTRS